MSSYDFNQSQDDNKRSDINQANWKKVIFENKSAILNILSIILNIIVLFVLISSTKSQIDEMNGSIKVFQNVIDRYINNAPNIRLADERLNAVIVKLNNSEKELQLIENSANDLSLLDINGLSKIGDLVVNISHLKMIVDVLTKTGSVDYSNYVKSNTNDFKPIVIYSDFKQTNTPSIVSYWFNCDKICNTAWGLLCCYNYTELVNMIPYSVTLIQKNNSIIKQYNSYPPMIFNMNEYFNCINTKYHDAVMTYFMGVKYGFMDMYFDMISNGIVYKTTDAVLISQKFAYATVGLFDNGTIDCNIPT